ASTGSRGSRARETSTTAPPRSRSFLASRESFAPESRTRCMSTWSVPPDRQLSHVLVATTLRHNAAIKQLGAIMSRSNSIKSNLADEGLRGPWEKSSHESPQSGDDWTVSLLKSLIAASGKSVKEAAFDLGMSETHLADHCAGRRVLAAHRLERFV